MRVVHHGRLWQAILASGIPASREAEESPDDRRHRIFLRFLFGMVIFVTFLGLYDAITKQRALLYSDIGGEIAMGIAFLLHSSGERQRATNTAYWSAIILFSVALVLVPANMHSARVMAVVLLISVSSGSVVLIGISADRPYQINVTFMLAMIANILLHMQLSQGRFVAMRSFVAYAVLLSFLVMISHFVRRLSGIATSQFEAHRQLTIDLRAIHDAETVALDRITTQYGELCHSIRTPLTSLMNLPRLLRDTGLSEKQLTYVDFLEEGHANLLNIVNDSLLGEHSGQQVEETMTTVSVEEFFRSIVSSSRESASLGDKKIICDFSLTPPKISLPAADVRTVVSEVLKNAMMYASDGTITLRTSCEPAGYGPETGRLSISVVDTGPGIDGVRLAQIRFGISEHRGTQPSSSVRGLVQCRNLVSAHRGSMRIDSTVGIGTTVTIDLPVQSGCA